MVKRSCLSFLAAIAIAGASLSVAACGGGGSASSSKTSTSSADAKQVVAEVAGTPITRAEVSHWMKSLAGIDYYAVSLHTPVPPGLVSDPPDEAHCVKQLETTIKRARGHLPETSAQLAVRCRQLNESLRVQATAHLVAALRVVALAQKVGINATEAEARQRHAQSTAREYPTQADYRRYLTNTDGSASDGLLEAKVELLSGQILKAVNSPAVRARYLSTEQGLASKITCSPGYVVEYCKQYTGGSGYPGTQSPSVQMEQLATLVTGRCVQLQACAKQEAEK